MEIIGFDTARIVLLTQIQRRAGQIYLPDVIEKVVARYSFVKAPAPDQTLPYTFGVGKFQKTQISEFSLYNDGIIVSSATDTDILNSFIDDLTRWAFEEFQLEQSTTVKTEKYYESGLVVKANCDLTAACDLNSSLYKLCADAMTTAKIDIPLKPSGVVFDFDPADVMGKRKPSRLVIDRRLGQPFDQNIFYSQSPLSTKDHLHLLEGIERIAKRVN